MAVKVNAPSTTTIFDLFMTAHTAHTVPLGSHPEKTEKSEEAETTHLGSGPLPPFRIIQVDPSRDAPAEESGQAAPTGPLGAIEPVGSSGAFVRTASGDFESFGDV